MVFTIDSAKYRTCTYTIYLDMAKLQSNHRFYKSAFISVL